MITHTEFRTALNALFFIDRQEVMSLTDNQWKAFRDDPLGFYRGSGKDEKETIWRAVERVLAGGGNG
jgi:hypothetical protein